MADRPTHAQTVHAVLVEAPLWLVWRVAYGLGVARETVAGKAAEYMDLYLDATPVQRRLTVTTAVLAVLFLGMSALALSLLV